MTLHILTIKKEMLKWALLQHHAIFRTTLFLKCQLALILRKITSNLNKAESLNVPLSVTKLLIFNDLNCFILYTYQMFTLKRLFIIQNDAIFNSYLTMSTFSSKALENKLALISGGGTGICYGISKKFL